MPSVNALGNLYPGLFNFYENFGRESRGWKIGKLGPILPPFHLSNPHIGKKL